MLQEAQPWEAMIAEPVQMLTKSDAYSLIERDSKPVEDNQHDTEHAAI